MPPGCLRRPHVCKICFFFLFCNRWHPANLSGAVGSLMAIINSVSVGRGSKSVGEFTYRYTRGRTIASRRITRNTSKTPAQVGRRGAFGSFVWMFSPYKWFFSDGYEKTKHGSSFNQFVHVNRELLGKSPYNSEVNKKLIPNGARLYSLITAIVNNDVPHLKYASYGTLNFIDESILNSNAFTYFTIIGTLFVEDFKGITITINAVLSDGRTFVKDLNLYETGDIPSFNKTYSWITSASAKSITIKSDTEKGTVDVSMASPAVLAYLLNLESLPESTISGRANIFIKQYGKIATIKRLQSFSLSPEPTEDEEKSSEIIQEDNTEIK